MKFEVSIGKKKFTILNFNQWLGTVVCAYHFSYSGSANRRAQAQMGDPIQQISAAKRVEA
jgi:hypothetical protein